TPRPRETGGALRRPLSRNLIAKPSKSLTALIARKTQDRRPKTSVARDTRSAVSRLPLALCATCHDGRGYEQGPVRARLCARPEDWPWSSARAHLAGADDDLVSVRPLSELISDCDRFIGEPDAMDIAHLLHGHAGTGRPLGPYSFAEALEERLGRPLKRQKPGPKPSRRDSNTLDLFELLERD
ncbi:hypothetical protein SAMN05421783_1645, partial [Thiocapsa roseopersicina]